MQTGRCGSICLFFCPLKAGDKGDGAKCKFEVSIVTMVRNVRCMELPPAFADANATSLL